MQNSQSNGKQCKFLEIQNHDLGIPVKTGQECSAGFRNSALQSLAKTLINII